MLTTVLNSEHRLCSQALWESVAGPLPAAADVRGDSPSVCASATATATATEEA